MVERKLWDDMAVDEVVKGRADVVCAGLDFWRN